MSEKFPRHIAIIMDGNGRWANGRGLPRFEGHKVGAEVVRKITEYCTEIGIRQLTLYCLSSENWKRPKEELEFLMQLLSAYIVAERPTMLKNNIRLAIIGSRQGIPEPVLAEMDESVRLCSQNDGLCLCLAINYGSRSEIVDAVKSIIAEGIRPEEINEATISEHLYTNGMSDPDLLIRTAGEMRLSNYLLWQLSYAEIWVTQTCWPDFTVELLQEAINDYARRDRKFGGLIG
ncbi:MAG: isoprenyl transferase [Planctomycetaceae bacterium]|nr:isoprenyl transferase [Planctomycetaceae bacterium]